MFELAVAAYLLTHDAHAPELDMWYKSLRAINGIMCCDGSDAFSVLDPDWETTTDPANPYKVLYNKQWIEVPADRVVKDNNRAGIAKVWPVTDWAGKTYIRCFLPGSFT